jgi:hypothetical protein
LVSSGGSHTLTLTPASGVFGAATVTVSVEQTAGKPPISTTFYVIVQ